MQTKKRAKPVKFGVKAKETEKTEEKVEVPAEESQTVAAPDQSAPAAAKASESTPPTTTEQAQNDGLVDKLSDVPFETDFGTPSAETAKPAASAPTPVTPPVPTAPIAPAAPIVDPVSFTETSTNPAETHVSEEAPKVDASQTIAPIDVSQDAVIPPIGRANEPIPFNPHETVFNTPPDAGEKKKNPVLYFLIIALVAFVTGIAFMAGIYYAMPNKNFFAMPSMPSLPGAAQATPTPVPVVAAPTVAPTTEVKLADYKVRVLNGSGISGQAAKVKALLEAEGFMVTSVGNAETSDVAKTQITYKKEVTSTALEKVKSTLKKTYVLEKETLLPSAAAKEADITITIGKETAK